MKKTKVVCTMGPNTNDKEMMRKLMLNGMDVARFNFSHGDHAEQKSRMDLLKQLREEEHTNTAILLDTKGPEIRTGRLKDGKKVMLETGATFTLTVDDIEGDDKKVSISYEGLVEDIDRGNTILIDILPSSRRGEGVGYYGLANNIAMSFGPMIGLFMHESVTYDVIFLCALLSCGLGILMAYMVKTPYKPPVKREPISLDRFFLVKGTLAGISLLLLSIPYGMTTTYVAMYADEIGIDANSGLYFTFMAIGLAVSRLFSGRQVDKGRVTLVISLGMYLAAISFFLLAALKSLMAWNHVFTSYLYIGIALSQGVAFGTMFPAFNTLFVNLAPNNQRGTATSTYLTSWDVGIGIGLMVGGSIAQRLGGFEYAYLFGACLTVISTLFFLFKAGPHFNRNKLR